MLYAFAVILFLLAAPVQAEPVYVWTDDEGNRHFSDKPPETAEPVQEETYELENIDGGYPYTDPDLYKDRTEGYLERRRSEQAAAREEREARATLMAEACARARNRLAAIQGRVNFIDDDGNVISVSEAERRAEEHALRREIDARCN